MSTFIRDRVDAMRDAMPPGLLLVAAAGLILRLSTIRVRGLWLDETVTIDQTVHSLAKTIERQVGNVHPPLFHVLMHFWIRLWGTSELALRSFSLVFGMAAIFAAFWAGRALYDRRTGLIAAGVLAFSPYHIWYSQEARMYSMMMLFGLLSLGFLALAMREGARGQWAGYGVATGLGMFTHYFFLLLVAGEVAYLGWHVLHGRRIGRAEIAKVLRRPALLFEREPRLRPLLVALGIPAALNIAWMARAVVGSALVSSISNEGLGYGQAAPSLALRFNDVAQVIVEMTVGFHAGKLMYALVAMWPLLVYFLLAMLDRGKPQSPSTMLLLFATAGMPVAWLAGQWQGQVLASRYFMALAAPVVILVARLAAEMRPRTSAVLLTAGALLAVGLWADQSFDRANLMRYDYREALQLVAQRHQDGDVVVFEPFYTDVLVDYYLPKSIPSYGFPQYGEYGMVRDAKVQIGQDLDRVVGPSRRIWLVLGYQNIARMRGDAYNTEKWFVRNGYHVAEHRMLNQVEIIRYEGQRQGFMVPGGTGR
ncbi:MAG TPA: glycosyltransferase family 39 protein [Coriobacteriia bacterium]|jgi:hypothetical protein